MLDYLAPWIDVYKIDLKSFNDRQYRKLGGRIAPILDTIRALHERGIWIEIVTLLVPGFNDDPQELRDLAQFLAGISPDIPWHVTAFHQDYKMTDPANTTPQMLVAAAEIGRLAGLHYVYAGNAPGRVGSLEDTRCPHCQHTVVETGRLPRRPQRPRAHQQLPAVQRGNPGKMELINSIASRFKLRYRLMRFHHL